MDPVFTAIAGIVILTVLGMWYRYEDIDFAEATVYLQGDLEAPQLNVDLPEWLLLQPGDKVLVLERPELANGRADEQVQYQSKVRFHKASWLHRQFARQEGLVMLIEATPAQ